MPDVPWVSIAGLRNIGVHEYFRVNPELILDIVDHELGPWRSASAACDGMWILVAPHQDAALFCGEPGPVGRYEAARGLAYPHRRDR